MGELHDEDTVVVDGDFAADEATRIPPAGIGPGVRKRAALAS